MSQVLCRHTPSASQCTGSTGKGGETGSRFPQCGSIGDNTSGKLLNNSKKLQLESCSTSEPDGDTTGGRALVEGFEYADRSGVDTMLM